MPAAERREETQRATREAGSCVCFFVFDSSDRLLTIKKHSAPAGPAGPARAGTQQPAGRHGGCAGGCSQRARWHVTASRHRSPLDAAVLSNASRLPFKLDHVWVEIRETPGRPGVPKNLPGKPDSGSESQVRA